MKKILLLTSAFLVLQAVPAVAGPASGADDKGGVKGERHLKMFEKQDTDKDGTISKDEFQSFTMQRFEEMDTDKDGKVTKDEAKTHHAAMREKWKAKREEMKKERAQRQGDDNPSASDLSGE